MAAWRSPEQHHSHLCWMNTLVSGLEVAMEIGELGGRFQLNRNNGLVISATIPTQRVCCSVWVHPDNALWAGGSLQCACWPCPMGRGSRETYFCIISTLIFTSGEKKGHIWQGFCLLLCFEPWEQSIRGNWRSDPAAIYSTARSPSWLQMWGTWRNFGHDWIPIVRGHSEQCLFKQHPFLLIIKEFRRKLTSSLEVFVLLNKYTEWKCPVLKYTFCKQWLMLRTNIKKITVQSLLLKGLNN